MSLASNHSLAEQNLQYHPKLDDLKLQLTRKYQQLQTLYEAYQMRKSRLGNFFESPLTVARTCFKLFHL